VAESTTACPHCAPGPESFRYFDLYEFDVGKARGLVGDGREPVEVDEESLRLSMDGCHLVPQHLDHVDPKFPGIISHVWYPEPTGENHHGHVLIDGNHRAARCLRDGLPYFAFVLSEDESRNILTRQPTPPASAP